MVCEGDVIKVTGRLCCCPPPLVTQLGGYKYVYVLCKLLSAALWKRYFASAPLHPGQGRRLRQLLLQAGGQRHPAAIVRGLLGHDSLTQVRGCWGMTRSHR